MDSSPEHAVEPSIEQHPRPWKNYDHGLVSREDAERILTVSREQYFSLSRRKREELIMDKFREEYRSYSKATPLSIPPFKHTNAGEMCIALKRYHRIEDALRELMKELLRHDGAILAVENGSTCIEIFGDQDMAVTAETEYEIGRKLERILDGGATESPRLKDGVENGPLRYYATHDELAKDLEGIDTTGMEIEVCSVPFAGPAPSQHEEGE